MFVFSITDSAQISQGVEYKGILEGSTDITIIKVTLYALPHQYATANSGHSSSLPLWCQVRDSPFTYCNL